jgi:hypothetical protein
MILQVLHEHLKPTKAVIVLIPECRPARESSIRRPLPYSATYAHRIALDQPL